MEPLLGPALNGDADYVSPSYARALSEGTLTTKLTPRPWSDRSSESASRRCWGGCAAVSSDLLDALPPAEEWDDEPTGQGAELRVLGQALAGDHALVEVHLGRKEVDPGLPRPISPTSWWTPWDRCSG